MTIVASDPGLFRSQPRLVAFVHSAIAIVVSFV